MSEQPPRDIPIPPIRPPAGETQPLPPERAPHLGSRVAAREQERAQERDRGRGGSERERRPRRQRESMGERARRAAAPRARRRPLRAVRLARLDPVSVFRFSLVLYTGLFIVSIVAGILLFLALTLVGALDSVTRLLQDLFADQTFGISGLWLLIRFFIVGAVSVVLWSGVNYLIALLYNAIADVIGGIEIAVEDVGEGPAA